MSRLPTPDPLTAVTLVFRSRSIRASAALDTTTAFLDAAVEMELCKACMFNSLRLLDRIWDSSLPETHPSPAERGPGNGGAWTRRKYLRTDRHYRRFQFRRAIAEAVKIENAGAALRMVQWLCTKFHGCIVPVTAVHTAAGKGDLGVLKFFKAVEIPARRDGGAAMRDEIESDKGHVVRWGRHDMEHAAANKQYETITWLYHNTCAPRAMKSTLMTVVHHGDIALLEWFPANYRTMGFDPDTEVEEYELTEADRDREDLDLYDEFGFGNEGALTGENVGELLRGDPEEFMRTAVFSGRLDVLKWMVQNGYVNKSTYLAVRPAVETNRLDIVEFLISNKLVEAGRALRLAMDGGKFDMARQLHSKYWTSIVSSHYYPVQRPFSKSDRDALWVSPKAMIAAIERGSLESVQWLVTTFGSEINLFGASQLSLSEKKRMSLDTVARRGELPLLRYLHKISVGAIATTKTNGQATKKAKVSRETSLLCTTAAVDQAAANNHLEVVKWLHSKRTEGCTTRAMDLAAANGHLQMVKWLSTHRSEGCTAAAMDGAASRGHLEVVKWLHRHRSEGCTTAAMDNAASGGHLEVVTWLHLNRSEGCTVKALIGAALNGNLEVVKYLHRPVNAQCTAKAMDAAAIKGHLEVVKWLHANRTEGCTTAAMDGAARNGKLDVTKWLHKNRSEGCTTAAMDEAKTLEIVQWLQANRVEGCTTKALDRAASDGDFDRILFFHSQRTEGCTGEAFSETLKNPLFMGMRERVMDWPTDNIHDWLDEHYPDENYEDEDY